MNKPIIMNNRAYALDALRGYAIITMVLSATIVSGILPGWMSHAQTPPPTHEFNPLLPGLTWVDLVFPSFLFAMGAAFPFSIRRHFEKGKSKMMLVYEALKRGLQLTFFAIFIQHFYPYMLSAPQDMRSWLLAILCFAMLFPMFMRIPGNMPEWVRTLIKLASYATATAMMLTTSYANDTQFTLFTSNVIILLLANMAAFASIIYIFSMNNVWKRLGIITIVMGIILSSSVAGSWTQVLFDYTPVPWMYRFDYLKYLFIVIPGSIAGEYLVEWMKGSASQSLIIRTHSHNIKGVVMSLLIVAIISVNLICLFSRQITANLLINTALLAAGYMLVRNEPTGIALLWKRLFQTGAFMILLGLSFEPFQQGIKKDPATFSYFFVTSGLSFLTLLLFNIVCDYFKCIRSTKFLIMSGQNPMIAYVAGDLLIMPLANITGLTAMLVYFQSNPWMGFLQGIILTSLSVLVTMFFTRIKWFWRT